MGGNLPSVAIGRTLRRVLELLVQKDYPALERLTRGVRLKASEIESGIGGYKRTLILPPEGAFSRADIIPIRARIPQAYSVRFRLFTREEGESDLELQVTLVEKPDADLMVVEIDNILVA
jgi:hypothetical protein